MVNSALVTYPSLQKLFRVSALQAVNMERMTIWLPIPNRTLFKSKTWRGNKLFGGRYTDGVTACSQRGKYCYGALNSASYSFSFKGLCSGTSQSISTLQRRTDEDRLNWRATGRVYQTWSVYLFSEQQFWACLISCHLGLDTAKFYIPSHAKLVFVTQLPSWSHRTKLAALCFKPGTIGWGNWASHYLFLLRYLFLDIYILEYILKPILP